MACVPRRRTSWRRADQALAPIADDEEDTALMKFDIKSSCAKMASRGAEGSGAAWSARLRACGPTFCNSSPSMPDLS